MSDVYVTFRHRAGKPSRIRIHYPGGFTLESRAIPDDYRYRPWVVIPSRDYAKRSKRAKTAIRFCAKEYQAQQYRRITAIHRRTLDKTFAVINWHECWRDIS